MKTFKLIKLQIVESDNTRNFSLLDGLIINKEDDKHTWILEAFLRDDDLDYFQRIQQKREDIEVLAVITNERNDPASLFAQVHEVRQIGDKVSVLFKGQLKNQRNEYAGQLLDHLVSHTDLTGNALIDTFREQMKKRPRLNKS
ncbi:YwpF family protein [Jeotgalibacillus marinus]|uniref:YwpF family protein n=1 Tax=Jeotgalibacillus marinus TaxID=86667 RepID=A0ABV3Q0Q5_9BACL